MNIKICPIKRLYQILAEETSEKCCAVISSSSGIDAARLQGIPYVFRQYEDLDYECPGRSFSRVDAMAFAGFLRGQDNSTDALYCCCDAGESRSPAVAAAVMRYFGMDDAAVWHNPHYHPNMLVFAMLAEELGLALSDEEIDSLFYTNQKAFRDAIYG